MRYVLARRSTAALPSGAPSYLDLMSPLRTWFPISGSSPGLGLSATNVFDNVKAPNTGQYGNSGPNSVFYTWCGAAYLSAYSTSGANVFWGGGHQDYYGNEVYVFDLASRTWLRITSPSTESNWSATFTNGILADGKPNVPHTYYYVVGRGAEFVTAKRQRSNLGGDNVYQVSRFNSSTLSWSNSTAVAATIDPSNDEGVCYDSLRNALWMVEVSPLQWAKYDFTLDSWTTYTDPTGSAAPRSGPVYCTAIDAVVVFVGGAIWGLDPASPTTEKIVIAPSGTAPTITIGDMAHWSNNLGAIVYYPSKSSSIYLLTPPAGNWRTGTWAWSQLSMSGATGSHPNNGTYGKFQLHEWGSSTMVSVCGDVSGPVYASRLT